MMSSKTKEGQGKELEDSASEDSITENSNDLDSDYIPSSGHSSDTEQNASRSKFGEKLDQLQEASSTSHSKHFGNGEKKSVDGDKRSDYMDSEDNMDTDYTADNEDEDSEEEGRQHVYVRTYKKEDKRKYDKKQYCLYCQKGQSKMARHLLRKHSDEKEVWEASCLSQNSKKRQQILELLRKKGNYFHNIKVLERGYGELIPYRQPTQNVSSVDYLPCSICYGFFLKKDLWRHEKQCRKLMGEPNNPTKKRRVQCAALALLPLSVQSSKRCLNIIQRMVIDEVSAEVKSDPLICEFGDRLLQKYGGDRSKDGHVSQKMRELGRFVLAAKSLDGNIKRLKDILLPPKFTLAVAAAKKASGFTNTKYRFTTPSLALKIGHSLKAAGEIVIGQYIKDEDESGANRVKNFLSLLAAEWGLYISRCARTNLEEDKWNKREMIPLTEDVMKLHTLLKSTEMAAKEKLMDGPNPQAYKTLCECLLAQIILFNRRRQGEAAKMPLLTFTNRVTEEPNKDVMQCLSKLEQDLSHKFTRLVIRGKRGGKVPVLLTNEMTESINFLIGKRSKDNDIVDNNEYIFARQNSETHIRGSDCLRKFAALSGAKRPETLTSTQLRKHVATLSQIMNLKDNELDQLAKFMGHDIRVHREYYRLTENTLQLAKISKLLMAVELGTEVYKGKSLDEIDLGLEIAMSAKEGPTQELDVDQSDTEVLHGENQDLDGLDAVAQRSPSEDQGEPSKQPKQAGKSGSRKGKQLKRFLLSAADSDGLDAVAQRSPSEDQGEPSKQPKQAGKSGSRKGKQLKRSFQSAAESDGSCKDKRPKRAFKSCQDVDVLRQKFTTGAPSANPKQKDKSCKDQGVKEPTFQSTTHRRPWSKTEKAAVCRQLGQYITLQRVPGKEPCLKALKVEPALKSRTWKDIKNQVYNTITAQKRKNSLH